MFAPETEPTQVADGVMRFEQREPAVELLDRDRGDVDAIVLTHAHDDHLGFAERARTELGVPVFVHEGDEARRRRGRPAPRTRGR